MLGLPEKPLVNIITDFRLSGPSPLEPMRRPRPGSRHYTEIVVPQQPPVIDEPCALDPER